MILKSKYLMAASETLTCNIAFLSGAHIAPSSGKAITINGAITASLTDYIFQGAGTVGAATAPAVSVAWWGALVDAALGGNSVPDFTASLGSNRTIYVPPATYTFTSTSSPTPCCAFNPPLVLVSGFSNFKIEAYGAVVTAGNLVTVSSYFHFHEDTNFTVVGLSCLGNPMNVSPTNVPTCLALDNDVSFTIRDCNLTGNWGGSASFSQEDWVIHGTIDNIQMPAVGIGISIGFGNDIKITHVHATGAPSMNGTGSQGQRLFGFPYDTPNAAQNHTGVSYTNNQDITLEDNTAANFVDGALISSGSRLTLHSNHWIANLSPSTNIGDGVRMFYDATADTGFPLTDVSIDGDIFSGNGSGSGYGVQISAHQAIGTADVMQNFRISAIFDNNNSIGIGSPSTNGSALQNVVITSSIFSGASQTSPVNIYLAETPGVIIHSNAGLADQGIAIICKAAPNMSSGSDTSVDVLATCAIPPMRPNDQILVSADFATSGSGGNKSEYIFLNTTSGPQAQGQSSTASNVHLRARIANVNSASSQQLTGNYETASGAGINPAPTTGTFNTASGIPVVIACKKAVATDVCTLTQYHVELLSDGT
jgi:hypothetical protein